MKKINILLVLIICLAIFVNFYQQSTVPGCVNADEAAFGYNAFSLLKTLRDEHGAFLPLRLLSFNDMKLPLYSYLSIPFIAIFGLTQFSTRLVGNISGILLVLLLYYFSLELFKNRKTAYLSAFLAAISPWIYIVSRHAHESSLSALLIGTSMWMLIRYLRTGKYRDMIFSLTSIFFATFAYHTARIFLLYIIGAIAATYLRNADNIKGKSKKLITTVVLIFILLTPFTVDFIYGANRVGSLFFTHNSGFQQKLTEYLNEDGNRILHNKLFESSKEFGSRYMQEISPEFLVVNGDASPRFGMNNLGLITPIEYAFVFIGLYFLFKNKYKHRAILVLFLALSPVSNSLTWLSHSLTRSYPMIIPLLIIATYGFVELYNSLRNQRKLRNLLYSGVIVLFIFFNINSSDLYFNHYFSRPLHIEAWQCGYEELAHFVKDSYSTTDHYFFTKRYGQPYIFLLYYMQYDPAKYQRSATSSKPDEYGFTQVEKFDKFSFELPSGSNFPKNSVIVGLPDEFQDRQVEESQIRKIRFGNEDIFWIYVTPKE